MLDRGSRYCSLVSLNYCLEHSLAESQLRPATSQLQRSNQSLVSIPYYLLPQPKVPALPPKTEKKKKSPPNSYIASAMYIE